MPAKNNFGQTVKALPKGEGGIGKTVSAMAKAKVKPVTPKGPSDDKIIRTMPITEKQLGQIKRHYGIK
jgi:hypothetical protein